jgi:hypothetical protein
MLNSVLMMTCGPPDLALTVAASPAIRTFVEAVQPVADIFILACYVGGYPNIRYFASADGSPFLAHFSDILVHSYCNFTWEDRWFASPLPVRRINSTGYPANQTMKEMFVARVQHGVEHGRVNTASRVGGGHAG